MQVHDDFWLVDVTIKQPSNHVLTHDEYANIRMNVMGDSDWIAHCLQSMDIRFKGRHSQKMSFPANHLDLIGDW